MSRKTSIKQVYGIIYGMKCDETERLYIGQTLSHHMKGKYWCKTGIKKRIKRHLDHSKNESKKTEFMMDIRKYGIDSFTIFIVRECPGKMINLLDSWETEMIEKYESQTPKGYNTSLYSTVSSKSKQRIMDFYKLQPINFFTKKESGTNSSVPPKFDGIESRIIYFQSKKIEYVKVTLVQSNNQARVFVKEIGGACFRNNFTSTKNLKEATQRAVDFAHVLSKNPIIHQGVKAFLDEKEENYKYQQKLEKFLGCDIRLVTGHSHHYKSHDNEVYLLLIYMNDKKQYRVSFGGKTQSIKESIHIASDFVDRLKNQSDTTFKIRLDES